jgi:hypothetical protein
MAPIPPNIRLERAGSKPAAQPGRWADKQGGSPRMNPKAIRLLTIAPSLPLLPADTGDRVGSWIVAASC